MSEFSDNSAFSKRWKNLEDYIKSKRSQRSKDEAYSHANDVIDK
jgi:hypothetical protein